MFDNTLARSQGLGVSNLLGRCYFEWECKGLSYQYCPGTGSSHSPVPSKGVSHSRHKYHLSVCTAFQRLQTHLQWIVLEFPWVFNTLENRRRIFQQKQWNREPKGKLKKIHVEVQKIYSPHSLFCILFMWILIWKYSGAYEEVQGSWYIRWYGALHKQPMFVQYLLNIFYEPDMALSWTAVIEY